VQYATLTCNGRDVVVEVPEKLVVHDHSLWKLFQQLVWGDPRIVRVKAHAKGVISCKDGEGKTVMVKPLAVGTPLVLLAKNLVTLERWQEHDSSNAAVLCQSFADFLIASSRSPFSSFIDGISRGILEETAGQLAEAVEGANKAQRVLLDFQQQTRARRGHVYHKRIGEMIDALAPGESRLLIIHTAIGDVLVDVEQMNPEVVDVALFFCGSLGAAQLSPLPDGRIFSRRELGVTARVIERLGELNGRPLGQEDALSSYKSHCSYLFKGLPKEELIDALLPLCLLHAADLTYSWAFSGLKTKFAVIKSQITGGLAERLNFEGDDVPVVRASALKKATGQHVSRINSDDGGCEDADLAAEVLRSVIAMLHESADTHRPLGERLSLDSLSPLLAVESYLRFRHGQLAEVWLLRYRLALIHSARNEIGSPEGRERVRELLSELGPQIDRDLVGLFPGTKMAPNCEALKVYWAGLRRELRECELDTQTLQRSVNQCWGNWKVFVSHKRRKKPKRREGVQVPRRGQPLIEFRMDTVHQWLVGRLAEGERLIKESAFNSLRDHCLDLIEALPPMRLEEECFWWQKAEIEEIAELQGSIIALSDHLMQGLYQRLYQVSRTNLERWELTRSELHASVKLGAVIEGLARHPMAKGEELYTWSYDWEFLLEVLSANPTTASAPGVGDLMAEIETLKGLSEQAVGPRVSLHHLTNNYVGLWCEYRYKTLDKKLYDESAKEGWSWWDKMRYWGTFGSPIARLDAWWDTLFVGKVEGDHVLATSRGNETMRRQYELQVEMLGPIVEKIERSVEGGVFGILDQELESEESILAIDCLRQLRNQRLLLNKLRAWAGKLDADLSIFDEFELQLKCSCVMMLPPCQQYYASGALAMRNHLARLYPLMAFPFGTRTDSTMDLVQQRLARAIPDLYWSFKSHVLEEKEEAATGWSEAFYQEALSLIKSRIRELRSGTALSVGWERSPMMYLLDIHTLSLSPLGLHTHFAELTYLFEKTDHSVNAFQVSRIYNHNHLRTLPKGYRWTRIRLEKDAFVQLALKVTDRMGREAVMEQTASCLAVPTHLLQGMMLDRASANLGESGVVESYVLREWGDLASSLGRVKTLWTRASPFATTYQESLSAEIHDSTSRLVHVVAGDLGARPSLLDRPQVQASVEAEMLRPGVLVQACGRYEGFIEFFASLMRIRQEEAFLEGRVPTALFLARLACAIGPILEQAGLRGVLDVKLHARILRKLRQRSMTPETDRTAALLIHLSFLEWSFTTRNRKWRDDPKERERVLESYFLAKSGDLVPEWSNHEQALRIRRGIVAACRYWEEKGYLEGDVGPLVVPSVVAMGALTRDEAESVPWSFDAEKLVFRAVEIGGDNKATAELSLGDGTIRMDDRSVAFMDNSPIFKKLLPNRSPSDFHWRREGRVWVADAQAPSGPVVLRWDSRGICALRKEMVGRAYSLWWVYLDRLELYPSGNDGNRHLSQRLERLEGWAELEQSVAVAKLNPYRRRTRYLFRDHTGEDRYLVETKKVDANGEMIIAVSQLGKGESAEALNPFDLQLPAWAACLDTIDQMVCSRHSLEFERLGLSFSLEEDGTVSVNAVPGFIVDEKNPLDIVKDGGTYGVTLVHRKDPSRRIYLMHPAKKRGVSLLRNGDRRDLLIFDLTRQNTPVARSSEGALWLAYLYAASGLYTGAMHQIVCMAPGCPESSLADEVEGWLLDLKVDDHKLRVVQLRALIKTAWEGRFNQKEREWGQVRRGRALVIYCAYLQDKINVLSLPEHCQIQMIAFSAFREMAAPVLDTILQRSLPKGIDGDQVQRFWSVTVHSNDRPRHRSSVVSSMDVEVAAEAAAFSVVQEPPRRFRLEEASVEYHAHSWAGCFVDALRSIKSLNRSGLKKWRAFLRCNLLETGTDGYLRWVLYQLAELRFANVDLPPMPQLGNIDLILAGDIAADLTSGWIQWGIENSEGMAKTARIAVRSEGVAMSIRELKRFFIGVDILYNRLAGQRRPKSSVLNLVMEQVGGGIDKVIENTAPEWPQARIEWVEAWKLALSGTAERRSQWKKAVEALRGLGKTNPSMDKIGLVLQSVDQLIDQTDRALLRHSRIRAEESYSTLLDSRSPSRTRAYDLDSAPLYKGEDEFRADMLDCIEIVPASEDRNSLPTEWIEKAGWRASSRHQKRRVAEIDRGLEDYLSLADRDVYVARDSTYLLDRAGAELGVVDELCADAEKELWKHLGVEQDGAPPLEAILQAWEKGNLESLKHTYNVKLPHFNALDRAVERLELALIARRRLNTVIELAGELTKARSNEGRLLARCICHLVSADHYYLPGRSEISQRAVLAIERAEGFLVRKEQLKKANRLIKEPNAACQIRLGFGKSIVVSKLVQHARADGTQCPMLIATRHDHTQALLREVRGFGGRFERPIFDFDFDGTSSCSREALHTLNVQLLRVTAERGEFVSTKQNLLLFRAKYWEQWCHLTDLLAAEERSNAVIAAVHGRLKEWNRALLTLEERGAMLIDEQDRVMDPSDVVILSLEGSRPPYPSACNIGAQVIDEIVSHPEIAELCPLLQHRHAGRLSDSGRAKLGELRLSLAGRFAERWKDRLSPLSAEARHHWVDFVLELGTADSQSVFRDALKKSGDRELYRDVVLLRRFLARALVALTNQDGVNYGREPGGDNVVPFEGTDTRVPDSTIAEWAEWILNLLVHYVGGEVTTTQVERLIDELHSERRACRLRGVKSKRARDFETAFGMSLLSADSSALELLTARLNGKIEVKQIQALVKKWKRLNGRREEEAQRRFECEYAVSIKDLSPKLFADIAAHHNGTLSPEGAAAWLRRVQNLPKGGRQQRDWCLPFQNDPKSLAGALNRRALIARGRQRMLFARDWILPRLDHPSSFIKQYSCQLLGVCKTLAGFSGTRMEHAFPSNLDVSQAADLQLDGEAAWHYWRHASKKGGIRLYNDDDPHALIANVFLACGRVDGLADPGEIFCQTPGKDVIEWLSKPKNVQRLNPDARFIAYVDRQTGHWMLREVGTSRCIRYSAKTSLKSKDIFVLYLGPDSRSKDFPRPLDSTLAVTIGQKMGFNHLAQAENRNRGLRDGQRLRFLLSEDLAASIKIDLQQPPEQQAETLRQRLIAREADYQASLNLKSQRQQLSTYVEEGLFSAIKRIKNSKDREQLAPIVSEIVKRSSHLDPDDADDLEILAQISSRGKPQQLLKQLRDAELKRLAELKGQVEALNLSKAARDYLQRGWGAAQHNLEKHPLLDADLLPEGKILMPSATSQSRSLINTTQLQQEQQLQVNQAFQGAIVERPDRSVYRNPGRPTWEDVFNWLEGSSGLLAPAAIPMQFVAPKLFATGWVSSNLGVRKPLLTSNPADAQWFNHFFSNDVDPYTYLICLRDDYSDEWREVCVSHQGVSDSFLPMFSNRPCEEYRPYLLRLDLDNGTVVTRGFDIDSEVVTADLNSPEFLAIRAKWQIPACQFTFASNQHRTAFKQLFFRKKSVDHQLVQEALELVGWCLRHRPPEFRIAYKGSEMEELLRSLASQH
jgi:Protein of unknown function (DUF3638)